MKKRYLPGLVLPVFLAAVLLAYIFVPTRAYSVREKRYLSTKPQIDAQTLKSASLSGEADAYLADQFPARDLFVEICAYFDLLCGKNTARDFILGRGGRLFAAPAQYDGTRLEANIAAAERFVSTQLSPSDERKHLAGSLVSLLPESLPRIAYRVAFGATFPFGNL